MYREETEKGTILLDNDKKYVKSLGQYSKNKVKAVCPTCGNIREVSYYSVTKSQHSMCRCCSKSQNAYGWMIGQKFGRLTIESFGEPQFEPSGVKQSTFNCICECGKKFTTQADSIKTGKTLSCGCYSRDIHTGITGKNHPKYRHDMTDEERKKLAKIRMDGEYRMWVRLVKERDKQCVICSGSNKLQVHHLHDFKNNEHLRYEVENGVVLCKKCHDEFHSWMGGFREPCTPDDFKRFLAFKKSKWSIQSVGKSIFSSLFGTNQR